MDTVDQLERTIEEYQNTLSEVEQNRDKKDVNWDLVQMKLIRSGGWTIEGAKEITRLTRDYGGFMLRNALAVASVLNIEDGELGL